jgi:hypothetical protein
VFENGRITLSGPSKDLLNSPEVAERYLGMGSATEVSGAASAALAGRLRDVVFPDAAPAGSSVSP